jgi:hypothetical protein
MIYDLDQFGVPFSRSFVPEYELLRLFESIGLTVVEASQKRRDKTLPKDIADAWDQYDALQDAKYKLRCDENLMI